jgi:hypothetical protein
VKLNLNLNCPFCKGQQNPVIKQRTHTASSVRFDGVWIPAGEGTRFLPLNFRTGYTRIPHTPSWRCAWLSKHMDNFHELCVARHLEEQRLPGSFAVSGFCCGGDEVLKISWADVWLIFASELAHATELGSMWISWEQFLDVRDCPKGEDWRKEEDS